MLSLKQVTNVCMQYQGSSQCRYLEQDRSDYKKCYCKKQTSDKVILDELIKEHWEDCKKKGINPAKTSDAQGDNCPGYPFLADILQGYDVP